MPVIDYDGIVSP